MRVGLCSFAHVHAPVYAARLAAMPGVELLAADDDAERGRRMSAPPSASRSPARTTICSRRVLTQS